MILIYFDVRITGPGVLSVTVKIIADRVKFSLVTVYLFVVWVFAAPFGVVMRLRVKLSLILSHSF